MPQPKIPRMPRVGRETEPSGAVASHALDFMDAMEEKIRRLGFAGFLNTADGDLRKPRANKPKRLFNLNGHKIRRPKRRRRKRND